MQKNKKSPKSKFKENASPLDAPTQTASPSQIEHELKQKRITSHLPIGKQFGSYKILRLLGKGGMGEVYEAEHLDSSRRVALKVLSHSLRTKTDRERFLREGRLAASINHPNSIYIYGTEEIDGTPVIAMEVVPGGTLKDRVKEEGPLPPEEAVDVIIQVIEGLEAAYSAGILHRDIKPSNCFIDADGTVKIGDFGLSISTLTHAESQLTTTGAFLGTPAFSPPEQLRGEEFNVRSDIYSLGATLYYLLTGKAPFDEPNMIKLVSRILEKNPDSPRNHRPEVAEGLAKAVLRCLEKKQAKRVSSYSELKKILMPFSSATFTPASLWSRISAKALDSALFLFIIYLAGRPISNFVYDVFEFLPIGIPLPYYLLFLLTLLYFALPESIWGSSLGKALNNIRVAGPQGENPSLLRSLLRSLIFVFTVLVLGPLCFWSFRIAAISLHYDSPTRTTINFFLLFIFSLILLTTARRRNGYAALHDLICRTRVIVKTKERAKLQVHSDEKIELLDEAPHKIGPYLALCILRKSKDDELILGYDERLKRKIWIQVLPVGLPAIPTSRQDISRLGRIRWINGKRTSEQCWDAYEAVEGNPFLIIIKEKQPWSVVRRWMLDLAEEISAGMKDHSIPASIGLDRVWITPDGRAKLLDFKAPGIDFQGHSLSDSISGSKLYRLFLKQMAVSALEGNIRTIDEIQSIMPVLPLPTHARKFLQNLTSQSYIDLQALIIDLEALLNKNAVVTVNRRIHLMAYAIAPLFPAFIFFTITNIFYDDYNPLSALIQIGALIGYWGILCIITAFIFRGGLSYRNLGVAVVLKNGLITSRLRPFLRSLIAWSPTILLGILYAKWIIEPLFFGYGYINLSRLSFPIWPFFALFAIFIIGAIWAIITPERGPQDRIVGTYLVPR